LVGGRKRGTVEEIVREQERRVVRLCRVTQARRTRGGRATTNEEQRPIYYLSAEGLRRLQQRLQGYRESLRLLQTPPSADEAHDFSDQADTIEEADDAARLADQIALLEQTLSQARPLAAGPDDGVIRQGSSVVLRDARGGQRRFTLLEGIELEADPEEIAIDSPLGRALLGHTAGDAVAVRLPAGEQRFTIVAVEPYRPPTP
jgi:transcription elongation factor GreA